MKKGHKGFYTRDKKPVISEKEKEEALAVFNPILNKSNTTYFKGICSTCGKVQDQLYTGKEVDNAVQKAIQIERRRSSNYRIQLCGIARNIIGQFPKEFSGGR